MDERTLFNWGFWDGFHSEQRPQQDQFAYRAGFACGVEQKSEVKLDPEAQQRAFQKYLNEHSNPDQED